VRTPADGPPPYPRIPHLLPTSAGTRDDLLLSQPALSAFFAEPVLVEEKLDGANVSLWARDGRVQVAGRGGLGAIDRAAQLGRLRAWVAERTAALLAGLRRDVLYGEWLHLTHGVPYDRLPSLLVGLDLLTPAGWATPLERDARLAELGVPPPPALFDGVLGTADTLSGVLEGLSPFGSEQREGVVVRRRSTRAEPRLAKVVSTAYRRPADADWRRGRPVNKLGPPRV